MPPGTLLRGYRGRWTAGRCHLERFCGDTVAGGRQDETPGTLLRGFRARWAAGSDTWNTFAGIPCQVEGREGHLERFRGDSVAGGRRERRPGTLSRENRARWAAGWDTWHSHSKSKITVRVTESLTAGSHGAKGLLWFLPPESRCERKKERTKERNETNG